MSDDLIRFSPGDLVMIPNGEIHLLSHRYDTYGPTDLWVTEAGEKWHESLLTNVDPGGKIVHD